MLGLAISFEVGVGIKKEAIVSERVLNNILIIFFCKGNGLVKTEVVKKVSGGSKGSRSPKSSRGSRGSKGNVPLLLWGRVGDGVFQKVPEVQNVENF